MSAVERRRSLRIPFFEEEAAVIHAISRDIPVKIVDLSYNGALFSLDMLAPEARTVVANQQLHLSMHAERSVFQVTARVVRVTHEFIAVEFIEDGGVQKRIAEKLRSKQAKST